MNELAIVANPNGDIEKAQAVCAWIRTREAEILADIEAVEVTENNWKSDEVKSKLAQLKKMIEDVRDAGKKLVERVVADTEAQRVLSQIDSRLWSYSTKADPGCTYAKLSDAYKTLKAKVDSMKDAHTPPAPRHTYVMQFELTDKELEKMLKDMAKSGIQFRYSSAQSDKAVKQIDTWFKENGGQA